MANGVTLPNMGLVKWDQLDDIFNHDQLANNFQRIDDHNHTPGNGAQIPAGALGPLSVSSANIQDGAFTAEKLDDGAITTSKLADLSVTTPKLTDQSVTSTKFASGAILTNLGSGGIPDGNLASPTSGVYRVVARASGGAGALTAGSLYIFTTNGLVLSGADMVSNPPVFVRWTSADFAIPNKTTKVRIRADVAVNATTPVSNFSFTMNRVDDPPPHVAETSGGAGQVLVAPNSTPVTGSTTVVTNPLFRNPGSASPVLGDSGDFTQPADGLYVFGVVSSATFAANSAVICTLQLEVHSV